MAPSLMKTRPGIEMHMGALLREALAFQGIGVRVEKPGRSLPNEYLVAERGGFARVWVHAMSCNGDIHYDIPRSELMAVAAVVSDHVSTRFIYDGFSHENPRPAAQARAMATAVARHFGMPVREMPDPFTECACSNCNGRHSL
ncbi:hypothetical protein ACF05W_03205 [Streptomyces lydicus]|uniref:hypothetical protein n=1 Tax=Streptomyces lydicus TaxID=47763 RepID=UPI0037002465